MKLADMLNAYAQSTGDKIMHRVGVAEALVQLVETSRISRINAIDQFRDAMIGYVNESVELMKSADVNDKDELAASIRALIEDMHADRRDILAGDPPSTFVADIVPPRPYRELPAVTSVPAPPGIDLPPFTSVSGVTSGSDSDEPKTGPGDKEGRGRLSRSAA